MFAAYSRILRQWFHVYPGGEEMIPEPPMWLCDDGWAKDHQREIVNGGILGGQSTTIRRNEKPVQLSLFK